MMLTAEECWSNHHQAPVADLSRAGLSDSVHAAAFEGSGQTSFCIQEENLVRVAHWLTHTTKKNAFPCPGSQASGIHNVDMDQFQDAPTDIGYPPAQGQAQHGSNYPGAAQQQPPHQQQHAYAGEMAMGPPQQQPYYAPTPQSGYGAPAGPAQGPQAAAAGAPLQPERPKSVGPSVGTYIYSCLFIFGSVCFSFPPLPPCSSLLCSCFQLTCPIPLSFSWSGSVYDATRTGHMVFFRMQYNAPLASHDTTFTPVLGMLSWRHGPPLLPFPSTTPLLGIRPHHHRPPPPLPAVAYASIGDAVLHWRAGCL